MKLARKFTFNTEHSDNYILDVYTAEQDADGQYLVTWEWKDKANATVDPFTTYSADKVQRNIINAGWRVQEVIIGPETPYEPPTEVPMKHEGRVIISCANKPYTLKAHESGERYILVGTNGMEHDHNYTDAELETNVNNYGWKWVEPQTSNDIVADAWPFAVSSVGTNAVEPEFLPPDDIPDLVPESLSLVAVRQFVKEFPQYTLELDEEYMVVKPVENAHGERSVMYLAKTEAELEAIMEAIRTLERFADRG